MSLQDIFAYMNPIAINFVIICAATITNFKTVASAIFYITGFGIVGIAMVGCCFVFCYFITHDTTIRNRRYTSVSVCFIFLQLNSCMTTFSRTNTFSCFFVINVRQRTFLSVNITTYGTCFGLSASMRCSTQRYISIGRRAKIVLYVCCTTKVLRFVKDKNVKMKDEEYLYWWMRVHQSTLKDYNKRDVDFYRSKEIHIDKERAKRAFFNTVYILINTLFER